MGPARTRRCRRPAPSMSVLTRLARAWPERWLPLACCMPGLGVAVLVGVGLAAAGPLLGLSAGTPALAGLVVMGLACPLNKLILVLVLRRQASCPMPVRRRPGEAEPLAALRQENARIGRQISALRSADSTQPARLEA